MPLRGPRAMPKMEPPDVIQHPVSGKMYEVFKNCFHS